MKMKDLIGYSAKLLKGRRADILLVCLLPLSTELLFRLAEASMYSLMLYFSDMKPSDLFIGRNTAQLAIAFLCTFFRWICTAPMYYACAVRLDEFCHERNRKYTRISRILLSRNIFRKSLGVFILKKIICMAVLTPFIFFAIITYGFVCTQEVFLGLHAIALSFISFILWINIRIKLMSVYFLMVENPEKSVFKIIAGSFRFMKGRGRYVTNLLGIYFFPMLTVIPIPFLLPELMTAYFLSMSIFKKEDEYFERDKIHSKNRKSHIPAKLSYRKKRRFKAYADTSETY